MTEEKPWKNTAARCRRSLRRVPSSNRTSDEPFALNLPVSVFGRDPRDWREVTLCLDFECSAAHDHRATRVNLLSVLATLPPISIRPHWTMTLAMGVCFACRSAGKIEDASRTPKKNVSNRCCESCLRGSLLRVSSSSLTVVLLLFFFLSSPLSSCDRAGLPGSKHLPASRFRAMIPVTALPSRVFAALSLAPPWIFLHFGDCADGQGYLRARQLHRHNVGKSCA